MEQNKMMAYADELALLRKQKTEFQEQIKILQEEIDKAEQNLILTMQENGCDGFSRNGQKYTLVIKEYPSAIPESKDEFYAVMKEHGYEHLFTINAMTLSGTLKEIKNSNDDKFPDWLEPYVRNYQENAIQIRKG